MQLLGYLFIIILLIVTVLLLWLYLGLKKQLINQTQQNQLLTIEKSSLEAKLEASTAMFTLQKEHFIEQNQAIESKLNEIIQTHLESKLKKFDETSLKSIENLLKPFGENLKSFEQKVELSQENTTKRFIELSKEIEFIGKAGFSISQEAKNLAEALKGKKQSQGAWGEMILESVLEYSGLLKGRHYLIQESFKDDQNKSKRPDVVVKLPHNRTIIIDSKVSLNDYEHFLRSEDENEKNIQAKKISQAFKAHIDTLSSKEYASLHHGSLEFVFMFVPIEGAFSIAVNQDSGLYEYALKKHIAIVTPSTLTVSLRTIYLYWQSEQSSTLAQKLFDEAGKFYDKMVLFAESYKKIGSYIQSTQNAYDSGLKHLCEGNGNLLNRTENLKKLGAKTTKNLKDTKIDFEEYSEDFIKLEA